MKKLIYLLTLLITSVSCDDPPESTPPHMASYEEEPAPEEVKYPLYYQGSSRGYKNQRTTMEDRYIIYQKDDYLVAAVFDGHGGSQTAEWLKQDLPKELVDALKKLGANATIAAQHEAIKTCYETLDKKIFNSQKGNYWEEGGASGSTAVVYLAINYPKEEKREMLINLGDSRAIVIRNNKTIKKTADHNLANNNEIGRLKAAGAKVGENEHGHTRVFSCPWSNDDNDRDDLGMTRAFGDYCFKVKNKESKTYFPNWISATPEIYDIQTQLGDFVVLASDGLWEITDLIKNSVLENLSSRPFQEKYAKKVIGQALKDAKAAKESWDVEVEMNENDGKDNISVIILQRLESIEEAKTDKNNKAYTVGADAS